MNSMIQYDREVPEHTNAVKLALWLQACDWIPVTSIGKTKRMDLTMQLSLGNKHTVVSNVKIVFNTTVHGLRTPSGHYCMLFVTEGTYQGESVLTHRWVRPLVHGYIPGGSITRRQLKTITRLATVAVRRRYVSVSRSTNIMSINQNTTYAVERDIYSRIWNQVDEYCQEFCNRPFTSLFQSPGYAEKNQVK